MNPKTSGALGPIGVRRVAGVALGAMVLALAPPAAAQTLSAQAIEQIRSLSDWKRGWTATERRIDSQLLAAAKMKRGEPITAAVPTLPGVWDAVRIDALETVEVDIQADVSDGLLSGLRKLGAQVESSFPRYRAIRARLPLLQVHAAADLPGVQFIAPAAMFVTNRQLTTNTGPNNSQGDAAHRAPVVRGLGINGNGVKIGVISDGVNSLAARQAALDLPAVVNVLAAGSGDEGTAMLEIVYDLAPQAQLYFATALNSPAAMASNILALKAAGCSVIVDDITYLNEGAFQDGPIAQAVNTVTSQGVLYFSSAANSGNKNDGTSGTWEGDYKASVTQIQGVTVHDFGGANSNAITATTGPVSLKWSDPLGLSANDYDLYVFDSSLTTILASSENVQSGSQDPLEFIGSNQAVGRRIVVTLFSGLPRALRIDTNRGRLAINTAGNTYGHNGGASTITVAATDARAAGGGAFVGGGANPVETYSSDGPRRIFYNPNGSAITPGNVLFGTGGGLTLQKPDITAADCVITGTPGFTTFCGTSAAAPHAGAIAALALSMASAPSGAQVKGAMLATALDIEAAGVDRDSGAGIVMADRIVDALQPPVGGTARFFTLSPCRVIDTRTTHAPALSATAQRAFFLAGSCGVPSTAKAVSVNVTVTSPTAPGDLRLFPGGVAAPLVSTINFAPGQTRANNAVLQVGGGATATVVVQNDAAGTVDFIMDVNGYFQ
jgi:hypothetical protein